jgi:hypothetical protein
LSEKSGNVILCSDAHYTDFEQGIKARMRSSA